MKHKNQGRRSAKRRVITIAALTAIIVLLVFISNYPAFIERFYSRGFYVAVCYLMHALLNFLPFSLGDLVYIAVVGYLLYAIVNQLRLLLKRRWQDAVTFLLSNVIGVQVTIVLFYLLWGLNYFRPPAAERLRLTDSTYTAADLIKLTNILIDSANSTRARLQPADLAASNNTIYHQARQAIQALSQSNRDFRTYLPAIKPSLLTGVINYMGTSGYYNPFTAEAQLNYQMPVFLRPFVACHEMSHQMGFGAEDEANFAGFVAATASNDKLLHYSAYYVGVQEFMHAVRRQDSLVYKQLKKRISKPVMSDFKADRAYWLSYANQIGAISSIFYDNFLKANNQPQGLETYNQMIRLVVAMYKKNGHVSLR